MNVEELKNELEELSDPEKAKVNSWFFKTGKGEYGEGSLFIGVPTADKRRLAKKYRGLPLDKVQELLSSNVNDFRFTALVLLCEKYKVSVSERQEVFEFYLKNTQYINNWDLVDVSAYKIVGDWLIDKDKSVLYDLAVSNDLWEKRIAIVSTYAFIRENKFEDTLKIAEILLNDKHDLIHKAAGWMLREVGKKNQEVLEEFLKKHVKKMPRTMLRYAIEKFEEEKRQHYLKI